MEKDLMPNDGERGRFWLRLTAPAGTSNYEKASSRHERERLRHAGLTSYIAPFVLIAPLLLLQQASGNLITQIGIVILMATACVALIFNRLGHQTLAALLLVLSMDAVIQGSLITAGSLSTGWLLTFDLFVIPLICAGILLSRKYVWIFMIIHISCILGDFYLLPHAPDLQTLIQVWHGPTVAFARPVIIQLGAGLLSFVEIRSTDEAITRAEKAEFVTKLQHQIRLEKMALETGIQEIVRILANAANGNYTIQSQLPRENLFWQVIQVLNTLFSRLQNARQNELKLNHTSQEIAGLLESLHAAKRGQSPMWPKPSGGLLDSVLYELRGETPPSLSSSQITPLSPSSEKPGDAGRSGPQTLHGGSGFQQPQNRRPSQAVNPWAQDGKP